MAKTKTTKTLYYLRAIRNQKPLNLQALVIKARAINDDVKKSEIEFAVGENIRIQHYREDNRSKSILLHLARYKPGDKAPTVSARPRGPHDDGDAQSAEDGREFQDGESYMLIFGSTVIFVSHGLSLAKSERYISFLLKKSNLIDDNDLDLKPASKIDKLALLQRHGVRSILLGGNAFALSIPEIERTTWTQKALGSVLDEFKALTEQEDDADHLKALEDLTINVELRLDGNSKATLQAQESISEVAADLFDEHGKPISEFTIITRSNEKITASSIRLQKDCRVEIGDKTIHYDSMWAELKVYLGELQESNLLEQ